VEASAGTGADVTSTARAGVGDDAVPGLTIGETFGRVTAFLKLAAANAPPSQMQTSMPGEDALAVLKTIG
jgi:hypothetical protein